MFLSPDTQKAGSVSEPIHTTAVEKRTELLRIVASGQVRTPPD